MYVTRYETETGLRLRNLETGEDRWVKYPVTRDDQESRFTRDVFPGYAFLPGGKEIVYNQNGKIRRLNIALGDGDGNSVYGAGLPRTGTQAGFSANRRAGPGESAFDPGSGGIAGRQENWLFPR